MSEQSQVQELQLALDTEIAQRLQLEKQIAVLYLEFEEFVSTTAHDVREPLRDIAAYSQLLAETDVATVDATAREYIANIRNGASRIESLTSAVVEFWAAPGDRDSCRTDMEAVLRHALMIKDASLFARATITHDALPSVDGDFEVLVKVLRHLIRNAVQYCEAEGPLVHISCKREGAAWTFSVADNGPGIEAAFHERILGAFKRLHGRENPGHGLGLAYCRKAVARHGGKIWVESGLGAGATFYFTLPVVESE